MISIQTRVSDSKTQSMTQSISDPIQTKISNAELEFMKALDFDCTIPLGLFIDTASLDKTGQVVINAFSADNTGGNQKRVSLATPIETINESILQCAEKVRQNK